VSCSYLVRYRGMPEDPDRFLDYYKTSHGLILREYPKIRSCLLHRAVPWVDPVQVRPDGLFVLAELKFDSIEDLNTALASEVRMRSRADFTNFPRFNGEISHQAVITEVLS
jgi:uncharacterized protein (TIGR02118 family)